jgi:DNA polymerase-3 subunit gamma/tau
MDLLEVDAASNTGVDNIRSLIESVRFQPTSGKYKVYIIDEAHMLSKGAWNALLKTLEEPPPRTVFVLATTEIAKVPATINSRAQRFDFRKFSENEIATQLTAVLTQEHKELSSEIVSDISVAAQGGMRDALTLLDQVLALGDGVTLSDARAILGVTGRGVLIKLLGFLHLRDAASLPAYFEELAGTYFDAQAVVRDLLELLRDLLELRVTGTSAARELTEANGWFSETDLVFLIRQYLRAYKEVAQSPEQYLPFFLASVEAVQKLSGQAAVPQAPPVGISQKNAPAPGAVATAGVKKNSSEPPVVAKASTVAAPIPPRWVWWTRVWCEKRGQRCATRSAK